MNGSPDIRAAAAFITLFCGSFHTAMATNSKDIIGPYVSSTEYVGNYFATLQKERTAIFYTECVEIDGSMAGIVIPVGASAGVFLERTNDGLVANTATLTWVAGQWQTEIAQGGVYTISRVNSVIAELLHGSFEIILPEKLSQLTSAHPRQACKEIQQN